MAFHPAARGRAMVETYRAAAEQYACYIVAGSNTSRNGPWAVSMKAVQAMSAISGGGFAIDAQRVLHDRHVRRRPAWPCKSR